MAIRTKADEYTRLLTLALEDSADYSMSTIYQRSGCQFWCIFEGFQYVHEVITNGVNILTLQTKWRVPVKIRYVTFGKPHGQETMFGSFCDDTVRAFSMESSSLKELCQLRLPCPWQITWDVGREQLLVADWVMDKLSDRVMCMNLSNDRKELEIMETALDAGTWIISWDQIGENDPVCFDFYKRQLNQYKIITL